MLMMLPSRRDNAMLPDDAVMLLMIIFATSLLQA